MLIRHLDVGIVASDLGHDARPQPAGEGQHVGFVHQCQVLSASLGPFERVGHHPAHTESRVLAYLGGDFVGRSDADGAAGAGVGPFGSLAHHHEVDVGVAGQRAVHSRIQPARPQVDVMVQLETQAQQQPSLQHTAGHRRVTDGPEQDRVMRAQLVDDRVRQ
ncbi:hypothetical protein A5621_15110 [Mycobacterium colombiense]|nr:hypothetical protein A5621_15110 [Mycobacterium colombiense]